MYHYSIDKMPAKGFVLAYFARQLVFEPYTVEADAIKFASCALLVKEQPREIHFFDARQEYRVVIRRFFKDVVELVLSEHEEASMDPDLLFAEDVLLKKEYADVKGYPKKVRIVNRYCYSQSDTLTLKNYRIALLPDFNA